jgi:hypothetical protein
LPTTMLGSYLFSNLDYHGTNWDPTQLGSFLCPIGGCTIDLHDLMDW